MSWEGDEFFRLNGMDISLSSVDRPWSRRGRSGGRAATRRPARRGTWDQDKYSVIQRWKVWRIADVWNKVWNKKVLSCSQRVERKGSSRGQ